MFCTKCGAKISEGATFCTSCGKPLSFSGTTGTAENTGTSKRTLSPKQDYFMGIIVLLAMSIMFFIIASVTYLSWMNLLGVVFLILLIFHIFKNRKKAFQNKKEKDFSQKK